jgi:acetyl esterase/lipase
MIATQDALPAGVPTPEPAGETSPLWPGGVPGAEHVTAHETFTERAPGGPLRDRIVEHVTRPTLTWFHPTAAANGVTLLIVPGGAYVRVVIDKEGFETAEWFAARGFECAVLRYRLPADGWAAGADAPVHDVMRAIRLLRTRTRSMKQARLGVMGFSAGGHVVARAITANAPDYARVDIDDDQPMHADFAILMYPVIATTGAKAHAGSAAQLRAAGVTDIDLERYSPYLHVPADAPPTLLIHAADDTGVPVENSLLMFDALRKQGVHSALHVFESGGHGFGLRSIAGKDVAAWPELARAWALAPHD